MPRTTILIEDVLLREIKKRAAEQGRSLQSLTNDLLRRGLASPPTSRQPFRWTPSPSWKPPLGLSWEDICDRNRLYEWFGRNP